MQTKISSRHRAPALVGLLGLLAVGIVAALILWQSKPPLFENAPKLVAALNAYCREQVANHYPPPEQVSLDQLVLAGYLKPKDVRAFKGTEVTFFNTPGNSPQAILVAAQSPDGHVICLLADGSVQEFTKSSYEQIRHRPASHPISGTNTSAAAP